MITASADGHRQTTLAPETPLSSFPSQSAPRSTCLPQVNSVRLTNHRSGPAWTKNRTSKGKTTRNHNARPPQDRHGRPSSKNPDCAAMKKRPDELGVFGTNMAQDESGSCAASVIDTSAVSLAFGSAGAASAASALGAGFMGSADFGGSLS